VPNGGILPEATELLIIEGNYLLLDKPGWRDLREFWDASIWLDVPTDMLRRRLVQRWIDHGLSDLDARLRAEQNDLVNANLVTGNRLKSTWILVQKG
jgi:pantothenate kinase